MPRLLSTESAFFIVGAVTTIILVVLDKAGRLKGGILIALLILAGLLTVPLAIGNPWVANSPSVYWKIWRGAFLVWIIIFAYAALIIWINMPIPVSEDNASLVPARVELTLDIHKTLFIKNRGSVPLREVKLFVTRYLLDLDALRKRQIKIAESNTGGGIPLGDIAPGDKKTFDLTKSYDFYPPGPPERGWPEAPDALYYCLRLVFIDSDGSKVAVYRVTWGVKDLPYWSDDPERGAVSIPAGYEYLYSVNREITDYEKRLFGGDTRDYEP